MATVRIDVQVPARLRRNLSPTALLGRPLQVFFRAITGDFRDKAAAGAPVDRGVLQRDHIAATDPRSLPLWGSVEVDNEIAIFVHYGTRPHWAPIRALEGWAARKGMNPYALQRSIAKKGTRANPWFERAVDAHAVPVVRKHAPALTADVSRAWGS